MHTFHPTALRAHLALPALLAVLLSSAAFAAPRAASNDPKVTYQRERAACAAVRPADAHDNCLSEASTRYAATQPPVPEERADILKRNALLRCDVLRGDDRQDCIARIEGKGSTSGSVASGGIYRELVTTEVGTLEAPAAAVAAPASAPLVAPAPAIAPVPVAAPAMAPAAMPAVVPAAPAK
jgi:hypothetical protein